ncbi:MAG: hypothetical protein ACXIVQ_07815 [Acidimicrobiales bacterium]
MNAPFDPHDDEIVSAVLDGEATEDERARVMADPTMSARLAELTAVRDLVAEPVVPLDELTSRRLVATALDRADAAASPEPATAAPQQPATRPWWQRSAGWVGSAAAAVAVVVGLANLATVGGGDDTATAGDVAMELSEQSADGAELESAPAEAFDSDDSLGGVEDEADRADDTLRATSVEELVELATARAGDVLEADDMQRHFASIRAACITDPAAVFVDGIPPGDLLAATGEVDGRELVVWLVVEGDEVVDTAVIDPATCELVDP